MATPPFCKGLEQEKIQRDYDSFAPSYDDLDDGMLSELVGFDALR